MHLTQNLENAPTQALTQLNTTIVKLQLVHHILKQD